MSKPHEGDTYECSQCGMQIEVKAPCNCQTGDPLFACCGESLTRREQEVPAA